MFFDPFSPEDDGSDFGPEFQKSVEKMPAGTFWAFVLAALLGHAGLFAGSLGLLLIAFRSQWVLGGGLLAGGLLALVLTVLIYRRHRAST